MNIKDFLIDHYGYIIIVIILTIVTIIGFFFTYIEGIPQYATDIVIPKLNFSFVNIL